MFIKNLFHYKIYSNFDTNTTIKLVNKLVDDGYKNEINSLIVNSNKYIPLNIVLYFCKHVAYLQS